MAENGKRKRRTHIPDKPEHPLNLWSIMKSCIGKVRNHKCPINHHYIITIGYNSSKLY